MGNDSGALGHYLMDHHFKAGAYADVEGYEDQYYKGRRPNSAYIPRFRNIDAKSKAKDYTRGFGYQGGASRSNWRSLVKESSFGKDLKEQGFNPGAWNIGFNGFGETLPYKENKVMLNEDLRDKWGLPTLTFDVEWKENEYNMQKDMMNDCAEMLEAAGYKNVQTYNNKSYPGLGIHEMGTARMGNDPKTSVLNKYNQIHSVKNVFITDGACMTSSACQNPSITYMALTARACDYAVKELKKQNL
jgi:choline dehydrogenase-like flavoprotein